MTFLRFSKGVLIFGSPQLRLGYTMCNNYHFVAMNPLKSVKLSREVQKAPKAVQQASNLFSRSSIGREGSAPTPGVRIRLLKWSLKVKN